jgi:CheY-like chemotaxis protein
MEAPGGAEALQLAAEHAEPIDLLLADIVMPGMSGYELAEQLTLRRPEMKVLFISGYYKEAELTPEANFLGKPFTPGELLSRVRNLLGVER